MITGEDKNKTRVTIYLDTDLVNHYDKLAGVDGHYQTLINKDLRTIAAMNGLPATSYEPKKCAKCNGTGFDQSMHNVYQCTACNGHGSVMALKEPRQCARCAHIQPGLACTNCAYCDRRGWFASYALPKVKE